MKRMSGWNVTAALGGLVTVIAVLALGRIERRHAAATEDAEEHSVTGESRVSIVSNEPVITLEQAAESRSGLVIAPLPPSTHANERRVQGIVVERPQQPSVAIQAFPPASVSVSSALQPALIQAPDGTRVTATLLPATASLERGAFLYAPQAEVAAGFLPGMSVAVYLPVGSPVQGVLVPDSAVVWLQGKAWVYVKQVSDGSVEANPNHAEKAQPPDRFVRRAISTETPVSDGWFVANGVSAGEPVVVTGAQLLLSEEFKAEIPEE